MGKKPVHVMVGLLLAGLLATTGCQSTNKKYGSYRNGTPTGMASNGYTQQNGAMARTSPSQGTIYSNPNNGATVYSVGAQQNMQRNAGMTGNMYTNPQNVPGMIQQSGYVNQGQPAASNGAVRYQTAPTTLPPGNYPTQGGYPTQGYPVQQQQPQGYYPAQGGMPQ